MTAASLATPFGGPPLDDALAATAARWSAHCLLEMNGRVVAHHVRASTAPVALVTAVLDKSVAPLEAQRQQLRTLGLVAGGAVVTGTSPRGGSITCVPLPGIPAARLWLVDAAITESDLHELAGAAERAARAHADGLDPLTADSALLRDCLRDGGVLPPRLVAGARHVRLLALGDAATAPLALAAALRRTGHPHLASAQLGDDLVVVLADDGAPARSAASLLDRLQRQGVAPRAALSSSLPVGSACERVREQVLCCLALALPGAVALADELASALVLERLRAPLAAAARLVDDPLAPLEDAVSRDVDFRGSLLAWLDAHGDIGAAATQLGVHVNTLRYRVRRACELLEVDLNDPASRLDVHLRLRLAP